MMSLDRSSQFMCSSLGTEDDVIKFVTRSERQYNSRRSSQILDRCRRIVDCQRPFLAAVDVFVQYDQTMGLLVWGSICFIL